MTRKVIYHGKTYEVWSVSSKGRLTLGERKKGYYGLFITHYDVKPEEVKQPRLGKKEIKRMDEK